MPRSDHDAAASDRAARAFVRRSAAKLLARPWLWATALRQAARMSAPGWWRRPPFLPLPDRAYLRFRLETQYGSAGRETAARDPRDLVMYLEWCRAQDRELERQRRQPRR